VQAIAQLQAVEGDKASGKLKGIIQSAQSTTNGGMWRGVFAPSRQDLQEIGLSYDQLSKALAKDLGKTSMTLTGTFMGSPSYMSPEQIRGRDVDLRSDLYSLAVLFYEIVTGRLPFTGQTTHDVVMKIMEGEFTFPKYIVPSLPEAHNNIILKGCYTLNCQCAIQSRCPSDSKCVIQGRWTCYC
jgi:serine/threonine protein kinase